MDTSSDPKEKDSSQLNTDEKQYPSKKIVLAAMAAIWLAFFLVALDRTIIGTAIPSISKEFNSFGDIAWYEAGFLLPLCVLQLSFGLVYKYYPTKWVLIASTALFELGSIVCATAPTSDALIIGRVITGIGGVGISTGPFLLITYLVPLASRPKYIGSLGSVFGITSAIGPIAGGYLTSITWRWCFWINVPVGGVSLLLLLLTIPKTPPYGKSADTWLGRIKQLDPIGFLLIAVSVVCLLFALQFGGTRYAWRSGLIIALFVVFGVFAVGFVLWQILRKEKATVPPRVISNRSVLAGCFAYVGVGSVMVILAFYLPIWFQVIQGKSPQSSGLSLLPLLLSIVVSVIIGGVATGKIGYYTPFMIVGSCFLIIGTGLISTWRTNSGARVWIGYQIVAGIGLGIGLQGPNIAVQTVLTDENISIALSLLNFVNFFGSTIFITVSQTLLENKLISGLSAILPDFDPSGLTNGGATSLRTTVSPDRLSIVLGIYNDSIRSIWHLALGLACVSLLASLCMEWKSVKSQDGKANKKSEIVATK